MTTIQEVHAAMLTFVSFRRKAAFLRTALDELKDDIAQYMAENRDEPVDAGEGCVARWEERVERTLDPKALPPDLLATAVALDLVSFRVTALDELDGHDTVKEELAQYVGRQPGTRRLDISSPNWIARRSEKSQARTAASPPAAPAPPAPVPAPTPMKKASQRRQAAPEPAQWECPEHGDRNVQASTKFNGSFCAVKEDGEYCRLNSKTRVA